MRDDEDNEGPDPPGQIESKGRDGAIGEDADQAVDGNLHGAVSQKRDEGAGHAGRLADAVGDIGV